MKQKANEINEFVCDCPSFSLLRRVLGGVGGYAVSADFPIGSLVVQIVTQYSTGGGGSL